MDQPRLYSERASWWPLLSSPDDYEEEAAFYTQALIAACSRRPRTLLEIGSGGGNNAFHMKTHFQITLVDRSPGMLAGSRALNPECEHIEGDMRTVRLGHEFDCVFIHDAIVYMTTESDLRSAIETAFVHCRPGGAALFAPDHVRETFRGGTDHGGHDAEVRGLRYLEWTWDPDPARYNLHRRLRVPPALQRRVRACRARPAHRRSLQSRRLAAAACRRRLSAERRSVRHSELEPAAMTCSSARNR